jgi:hypothetical protein
MKRALAATIIVAFAGCAADRYRWNLAHEHLMPNASKLPRADIEEITRLVSAKSSQSILGISLQRSGRRAGDVTVVPAYPSGNYPDDHGAYWLRRETGHWRIVEGGPGLSESVIGLALSED